LRAGVQVRKPWIDRNAGPAGRVLRKGPLQPGHGPVRVSQGRIDCGNLVRQRLLFGQGFERGEQLSRRLGLSAAGKNISPDAGQIPVVLRQAFGAVQFVERLAGFTHLGIG